MSGERELWCDDMIDKVDALEQENQRLKAEIAELKRVTATSLFGDETEFSVLLPFELPSLKNTMAMERRGQHMALVKHADVAQAQMDIRDAVELEMGGKGSLPLFGKNDVRRELRWSPRDKMTYLTWRNLGPRDDKHGVKDLVNMAAVVDDAVGSLTVGRKKNRIKLPGLVYHDDRQITQALDLRVDRTLTTDRKPR